MFSRVSKVLKVLNFYSVQRFPQRLRIPKRQSCCAVESIVTCQFWSLVHQSLNPQGGSVSPQPQQINGVKLLTMSSDSCMWIVLSKGNLSVKRWIQIGFRVQNISSGALKYFKQRLTTGGFSQQFIIKMRGSLRPYELQHWGPALQSLHVDIGLFKNLEFFLKKLLWP
jgi:hypothetical protein